MKRDMEQENREQAYRLLKTDASLLAIKQREGLFSSSVERQQVILSSQILTSL